MPAELEFLGDSAPLRQRALRLLESDETFREMCDDHVACAQAVARLDAGGTASDPMRTEYTALRLRLERELLRYLEEHSSPVER